MEDKAFGNHKKNENIWEWTWKESKNIWIIENRN